MQSRLRIGSRLQHPNQLIGDSCVTGPESHNAGHTGGQVLGPVRSTTGVTSVVRFGSSYATVPDQLIRVLQTRADPETGLHRVPPPAPPTPGSTVKIADGPFDGLEGVFECESGEDRAVVLLNMLGRNTRVQVPVDFILPNLAASGYR